LDCKEYEGELEGYGIHTFPLTVTEELEEDMALLDLLAWRMLEDVLSFSMVP